MNRFLLPKRAVFCSANRSLASRVQTVLPHGLIQNIWRMITCTSINKNSPGEIRITGNLIPGSTVIGILIIVYSLINESNIRYIFSPHSGISTTTANSFPSGMYNVSIFVVEESGLPFNRSASIPRNISVIKGKNNQLLCYSTCVISYR